jgi:hypothetical protein
MLGIYFFAYENRNEYTRDVYNIVDILSELGGLSTSILFAFGLIGGLINSLFYQMHFVNLLYFDVQTHGEIVCNSSTKKESTQKKNHSPSNDLPPIPIS